MLPLPAAVLPALPLPLPPPAAECPALSGRPPLPVSFRPAAALDPAVALLPVEPELVAPAQSGRLQCAPAAPLPATAWCLPLDALHAADSAASRAMGSLALAPRRLRTGLRLGVFCEVRVTRDM